MASSRLESLAAVVRSYLLYSAISALIGAGISYLMSVGGGAEDVSSNLLGGAVIGVTINSVIFGLELFVIQRLEARVSFSRVLLRIPNYVIGGMLGFLLGHWLARGLFPTSIAVPEGALRAWLPFMGLFSLVVGLLIYAYEGMRARLAESFERIKEQEMAEKELELARSIQKRLLPADELIGEGFHVAARNEAASYVAGDYFDIFRLGNGDIGLVVADVAGKGMGASLIMASAKAILPFIAGESSVAGTLGALNERLARDLGRREFVALCFARFSASERRVEIANAGLPDPYLLSTAGEVEALEVGGERLPLGAREGVQYSSREWVLEPGDRLFLFTDGLAEALTSAGVPLGYERLAELLPRSDEAPTDWLSTLFASLRVETVPELEDDWTAVVLSVS